MFTGIISEIGKVAEAARQGAGVRLVIEAPDSAKELNVSDSVSINGVCQTVFEKEGSRFAVLAVEETLSKTTLGSLRPQSDVNVELALQLGDRLGGHLVSGHVDCVGEIASVVQRDTSWLFRVRFPNEFQRYVIPVGSIAIDGVSLTVASIDGNAAAVSIIPHTMEKTIFSSYSPGSKVNVEFDLIGKYVEKLMAMGRGGNDATISLEQLSSWGYKLR